MRLPVVTTDNLGSSHFETGPRSIGAVRVLRISVTDRCNFRCVYCMPADGVEWLPREQLLTFEEIRDVVTAAVHVHGIRRFKLTGGEPTVRHGIVDLVHMLRGVAGVEDLSLTTNGFALNELAGPLRDAGLDRVTVSIDSLRPDRFRQITRTGDLNAVLAGLHASLGVGLGVKVNCVAMRGTNDDEFADFASLARVHPLTVRFIEYMPLGDSAVLVAGNPFVEHHHADGSTTFATTPTIATDETGPAGGCGAQDRGDVFIAEPDIRRLIESAHGPLAKVDRDTESGVGPAVPYAFENHSSPGRLGFISAMSAPFCSTCNRLRLTATGVLRSCLFDGGEVDLKPILRGANYGYDDIAAAMAECVRLKPQVHSRHGTEQMSRIGG
jgi:GTP 3',8-cyclase